MTGRGWRTKVCGAVTADDVFLLAAAGADTVGLWHGVPGGPADLDADTVADLAHVARAAGVEPVLVTFLADAPAIAEVLVDSGIGWVQLHAFQPPPLVHELRRLLPSAVVVKVLHLAGTRCLEQRFVGAYARAGTDLFLIDAVDDSGRVGSTGRRVPIAGALGVASILPRPFLLAGGIRPDATDLPLVLDHPGCVGIDVDNGARDEHGAFDPIRVRALSALTTVAVR